MLHVLGLFGLSLSFLDQLVGQILNVAFHWRKLLLNGGAVLFLESFKLQSTFVVVHFTLGHFGQCLLGFDLFHLGENVLWVVGWYCEAWSLVGGRLEWLELSESLEFLLHFLQMSPILDKSLLFFFKLPHGLFQQQLFILLLAFDPFLLHRPHILIVSFNKLDIVDFWRVFESRSGWLELLSRWFFFKLGF